MKRNSVPKYDRRLSCEETMGVEGNIDYAGARGKFQVYYVPLPKIVKTMNVNAIIICKRSETNSVTSVWIINLFTCKLLINNCLIKINYGNNKV